MKRKYFFFDIDGTLGLKLTKQLPADTAYCLKRLVQKGHFIALATGRAQYDAALVAKAYGIHSFVADGGNSLTLDGKILKLEPLPLTTAKAVLLEFEKLGIPWAAATENEPIMRSKYDSFEISGYTHFEHHYGTDDTIDSIQAVYKIFFDCPAVMPNLHGLPIIPYLGNRLLIEPTHKEKGIFELMKIMGESPEDAVVFGDGMNDISMFTKPFFCIAMGNAKKELKARADYVTDRNDAGGIVKACSKFGWI